MIYKGECYGEATITVFHTTKTAMTHIDIIISLMEMVVITHRWFIRETIF
jgi:hypothetical protein